MKTNYNIFFILIFTLLSISCDKMEDLQLQETVFIQDPYAAGLPIYSEWGYNTFGAYIDRKVFISTNYDLPAKIIVNDDVLHLNLKGRMDGHLTELRFSLKGYSPLDYSELTLLGGETIDLKAPGMEVILVNQGNSESMEIIEGEIEFVQARELYVDEESVRTILSGYFRLKTFFGDEPIAISSGRFDLGFGYVNFYNY